MLYISLVLSSILLLIAAFALRSRHPIWVVALSGAGLTILPGIVIFSEVVALQSLLLTAAVAVWCTPQRRSWPFLPVAFGVTVAAYLFVGWFAYQDCLRFREQFPYVALADRLPSRSACASDPLPEQTVQRLEDFAEALSRERVSQWYKQARTDRLEDLHEHTVRVFVNRQGFGVGRMFDNSINDGPRYGPVAQPGTRLPPSSAASLATQPPRQDRGELDKDLFGLHLDGVADFVNPGGFGFFKDRRHVAGFQSHQFSQAPSVSGEWKLQTLDLVGLVVHDRPIAYVSANLPRMEELRKAPTRPLDDFEAAALEDLHRGEDLVVREGDGGRRMLGAVRSIKQCVPCHEGQPGDLLGAFSYTFTRGAR